MQREYNFEVRLQTNWNSCMVGKTPIEFQPQIPSPSMPAPARLVTNLHTDGTPH